MRDLWGMTPRWARIVIYVWAVVVVTVLALLIARLVIGKH